MADKTCGECGHPCRSHSIVGCLHNGGCDKGCTVTYNECRKNN